MLNAEFNKETFKNSVKENVKMLYRKNLEEASQQEIYQAVCYAVKDVIIDNWLKTQKAMDEQDPKILYYMSMEFLMGRALGNNLINLTYYDAVKEALETRDLISPSLKGKLLQMIEEMEEFVIESPEKCTKTMQSMKKLLIDTKDR